MGPSISYHIIHIGYTKKMLDQCHSKILTHERIPKKYCLLGVIHINMTIYQALYFKEIKRQDIIYELGLG